MDVRRVGLPALLPYLRGHRGTLAVVAVLSLISAGASLLQPLLVRTVLDGIQASRSVAGAVALLVGLVPRVGADPTLLRAVVTSGMFEVVTGAVMVVGATIAMLVLDPLLFGVALVGLGLGLSVAVTVSRRVRGLSEQAQARLGEMTS